MWPVTSRRCGKHPVSRTTVRTLGLSGAAFNLDEASHMVLGVVNHVTVSRYGISGTGVSSTTYRAASVG